MPDLSRNQAITSWIAQLVVVFLLAVAGIPKLAGNPESIALFRTLGVEPWGRYGIGLLEVVAVLLMLRPSTAAVGGMLAALITSGAILSHLTVLGVAYHGDPSMFVMAVAVLTAALVVISVRRADLPFLRRRA